MKSLYKQVFDFRKKFKGGVAWRISEHCKVIEKHLNDDEKVIFAFPGQKNNEFYDIFTTCVVAITNKRILIGQKRVVWGYFLSSVTPDLYNDLEVYSGLIWGKVTIDTVKEVIVLTNLPKDGLDEIETHISKMMMKAKKNAKNDK